MITIADETEITKDGEIFLLKQQIAKLKEENEKLIWAIDEICKTMNEEKINLGMMNHVAQVARNAKEALGE